MADTKTTVGLQLCCPHCNEEDAGVRLHLSDGTLVCEGCENEVSPDDVRAAVERLRKWDAVFAWRDAMPTA
jgi:transcription elongation factor Elf1